MHLIIGITDTEARFQYYPTWIKGDDPDIEIIKLSAANFDDVKKCDGIILSGGVDTHPKFYHNERLNYPLAPKEFNIARDEFELNVFRFAQQKNIPVLGVCRGMQLVNVALGGDLIQDIEEGGKLNHRRHADIDGIHPIAVDKNSLLFEITGNEKEIVNSAHHQSLGRIANDLKVNAFSPDGVAEGLEWKNRTGKPFLLCVQWHPERLAEQQPNNPFTNLIRKYFLNEVSTKKTH